VCLPVTNELAEMLNQCDQSSRLPFITQVRRRTNPYCASTQKNDVTDIHELRKELRELRAKLGIDKRIILHDLRRTAAVELYRRTRDIRVVQAFLGHRSLQSTIWYLDNEIVQIDLADLEAIKKPFIAWRREVA
jgi:integrase